MQAPPLAADLADAANGEDEDRLVAALGAVSWYFGFHMYEAGVHLSDHVRALWPALSRSPHLADAVPLDAVLLLAEARGRYVATEGEDAEFERAFASFVSRSIGVAPEEASARAGLDAGPLIEACNQFLDRALADMDANLGHDEPSA